MGLKDANRVAGDVVGELERALTILPSEDAAAIRRGLPLVKRLAEQKAADRPEREKHSDSRLPVS